MQWKSLRRRDTLQPVGIILTLILGLVSAVQATAGDVGFQGFEISDAAGNVESIFAADMDGDGDLDVLSAAGTAAASSPRVLWYENRGCAPFPSDSCLGAQHVITLNSSFNSVFAADMDGDGDLDALATNYADDEIVWFENLGPDDGSGFCSAVTPACFGAGQVISTTDTTPQSVVAADLDGDGDLDALSASSGLSDRTAWYENLGPDDGLGSNVCGVVTTACFGPQQVILMGGDKNESVVAVDLDGDGDLDALAASSAADKIVWYENRLNEATADFSTENVISVSVGGVSSLFAADMDGDGDQDVLLAAADDDEVAWFENINLSFRGPLVMSTTADGAVSVFAGDIDGDGDMDAISASQLDDKIAWYENLGPDDGTGLCAPQIVPACFAGPEKVITGLADGASSVFLGDVDGDGDLDALSAAQDDDLIAWWENRTIHRNADFPASTTISALTDGPDKLAFGDVDGDGDPDILSADQDGDRISMHKNNGDGTSWTGVQVLNMISSPRSVIVADLDRDGDLDALSATGNDNSVRWHQNSAGDGSTWSSETITTAAQGANDVAAADLDGDGDLDALSASIGDDRIAWYKNLGPDDGSGFCSVVTPACFGSQQTISIAADGARSVTTADIDGDGDIDVVSASANDDKIAWYENTGGGIFGAQQIVISLSAETAQSVFTVDMDSDGDVDVLSGYETGVAWYENNGAGIFATTHIIETLEDGANEVFAADIDRDGDLDVLAALSTDNEVIWYENLGSSWAPHVVTDTASSARHAVAVDIDRDGGLDIVTASGFDDMLDWYRNQGGQFSTSATDTAQRVVSNGQLEDVLAVEVTHEGRLSDLNFELVSLQVRLGDSDGVPLASAQANALIETTRIYLDDGSGVFEETADTLVSTIDELALDVDGLADLVITDTFNRQVFFGTAKTFFVTFEMAADADSQFVSAFRVAHRSTADSAIDLYDIPLVLDQGTTVGTGIIDTTLTTTSCTAPFDLNLENLTINTTVECEAGTVLRTGDALMVESPGNLSLSAPSGVEIGAGFGVEAGAILQVK